MAVRYHMCVCLLFLLAPNFACAQDVQDPMFKDLITAVDSQIGSLEIHGRVISSDGRQLEDITILYFSRNFGDVVAKHEIEQQKMLVDSEFEIREKDISSIFLTILKEGYYSETWSYSFDEITPPPKPGGYEKIDIEIEMTERPEFSPLLRFEGALKTDVAGLVSVVEIKRQNGRETTLRRDGQQIDIKWPYLFLETEVFGEHGFERTTILPDGDRTPIEVIANGRIRPSQLDVDDGFIVYDPGVVPVRVERAFRKMVEAPDSGYKPELEIAAPDSPRWVYFYCRLKGQYGKGMVSGNPTIEVEDGRDVANARIVIYLNPNGSRDVASVHD